MKDQTTTPEGVIAALDELLKSAGANDVRKRLDTLRKGGIENSGFVSVGKEQGGGQASGKDEGSIETLMIAKMTALGIPSAKQGPLLGFLSGLMGKAENGEGGEGGEGGDDDNDGDAGGADTDGDDGDDDDDDDTAGMSAEAKAAYMKGRASVGLPAGAPSAYGKSQSAADAELEALAKSGAMMSRFRENTTVADDMDAAPFLSALVHEVTSGFDALAKSFSGARAKDQKLIKSLSKVVGHLAVDNIEQRRVISALGERLGIVERTPMPQRGVTSGAKPLHKSLGGAPAQEQMSKSEVLSTLTYMNLVKGQKQINGFRTADLVTDAEAADVIDQGTLKAVYDFHRENPNESEAAKSY